MTNQTTNGNGGGCRYAEDTGVFWCCNTWTRTRVRCKNPEHIAEVQAGKTYCASLLYIKREWDGDSKTPTVYVKSDCCCRKHCPHYRERGA